MPKDDLQVILARKAAQLLNRAYRRQKRKSWAALARRYGLGNKGRAYMIASGKLKPNPERDRVLLNAVAWEMDPRRHPSALRRLIRKIGLPFLARHQPSSTGRYGAGGRPVSEKG
jgi:hypothetical protein